MAENDNDFSWTVKLDWLNILNLLKLDRIKQISKFKKERAIKRVTKIYGTKTLLDLEPERLDTLIANELKELMKKELSQRARDRERLEKEIKSKIIPFKKGGIIRIDPRDLKDFNGDPKELMKYFFKKLRGDNDDDNDDERDKYKEDNTGYYI